MRKRGGGIQFCTKLKKNAAIFMKQMLWNFVNFCWDQRTILITDGVPSEGHSPCPILPQFVDAGIDLYVIGSCGCK